MRPRDPEKQVSPANSKEITNFSKPRR